MLSPCGVTKKLCVTTGAALKLLFPPCDASIITVPIPVKVTVLTERVAGPETIRKLTGRPEDALAEIVNGASTTVLEEMDAKLRLSGFPY